jgi:hypothetical protein
MGNAAAFFRRPQSWNSSWVVVGGNRFYARSRWEANYARFLEWQRAKGTVVSWEHEPETFWFDGIRRGVCSYLPDFKVVLADGAVEYHEVKGWMDAKSITKLKRMAKYHPTVRLVLIDSPKYQALERKMKKEVPGWEIPTPLPKKRAIVVPPSAPKQKS